MQTTLTCNLCRKDGPFTVLVAAGAAAASSAGAASEAAAAVADVIGATLRASGAAILRFSSPGRPPEYEAPVRGEFESQGPGLSISVPNPSSSKPLGPQPSGNPLSPSYRPQGLHATAPEASIAYQSLGQSSSQVSPLSVKPNV